MALNRKIKEETPQKILDLLRETRTGTNGSPSVAQSENPVSASPWRNFGTGSVAGEDSLLAKVRKYNQQREQQQTYVQNAQKNLANTYNIGNAPVQWENLTARQRDYYNTFDPEHKMFNIESSTNFSPVVNTMRPYQDAQGNYYRDPKNPNQMYMDRYDPRNPNAVRYTQQMRDDTLLNRLLNGDYDMVGSKNLEAGMALDA